LDTFLKDVTQRARARDDEQNISLVLDSPELIIPVDPARLAQVFDNLLVNATKYAPRAPIVITLDRLDEMAHIRVQDHGPGISAEHVQNLFKRFYRVPTNSTTVRGTGLGLFICRQIIRAHGGKITVESELGVGTAFDICLPLERVSSTEEHISLRESI
jgi:signal transduction histidine kinase